MRLALLQMQGTIDPQENLARALVHFERAAGEGAEMAVLPEMFLCPYQPQAMRACAQTRDGPVLECLRTAARKNRAWLVAGSLPERVGETLFNTSFVFSPQGELVAAHRKLHLFETRLADGTRFREADLFSPGDTATVFDTPFGRIGLCICFDVRFPELFRLMAHRGARLVLVPAIFTQATGAAHWDLLFRLRAADFQLFTAGIGPAKGTAGAYAPYAHSICCSPWGDVLCRAGEEESLSLVKLPLEAVEMYRARLPLLSGRRTDLYGIWDAKTDTVF